MKRADHHEGRFRELVAWAGDGHLGREFSWNTIAQETEVGTKDTARTYMEDAERLFLWHVLHRAKDGDDHSASVQESEEIVSSRIREYLAGIRSRAGSGATRIRGRRRSRGWQTRRYGGRLSNRSRGITSFAPSAALHCITARRTGRRRLISSFIARGSRRASRSSIATERPLAIHDIWRSMVEGCSRRSTRWTSMGPRAWRGSHSMRSWPGMRSQRHCIRRHAEIGRSCGPWRRGAGGGDAFFARDGIYIAGVHLTIISPAFWCGTPWNGCGTQGVASRATGFRSHAEHRNLGSRRYNWDRAGQRGAVSVLMTILA